MGKSSRVAAPPAFTGFAANDLAFLAALAAHNDRNWFAAHRDAFDDGLKPTLEALVVALNDALAARDLGLSGNPKKNVFRIHRDTRFSNDKRPYKTHVAATLTQDGLKMSPGMVYIHIEPEGGTRPAFDPQSIDPLDPSTLPSAQDSQSDYAGSGPFVAAGFYLRERPLIDAFRQAIAAKPSAWLAVEEALGARRRGLDAGDPVKRMPKGFEAYGGGPLEATLKMTSWTVKRRLTGAEITDAGLPDIIGDFVADLRPLLDFGKAALHGVTT